jgi:hypothetical protein
MALLSRLSRLTPQFSRRALRCPAIGYPVRCNCLFLNDDHRAPDLPD